MPERKPFTRNGNSRDRTEAIYFSRSGINPGLEIHGHDLRSSFGGQRCGIYKIEFGQSASRQNKSRACHHVISLFASLIAHC